METEFLISIGAILALLVLSAFFSGSETSLTAASIPRMHTLARQGNHRAELVNDLWAQKERLIGAILFGNNLVNIMASALATGLLIGLFGDAGIQNSKDARVLQPGESWDFTVQYGINFLAEELVPDFSKHIT